MSRLYFGLQVDNALVKDMLRTSQDNKVLHRRPKRKCRACKDELPFPMHMHTAGLYKPQRRSPFSACRQPFPCLFGSRAAGATQTQPLAQQPELFRGIKLGHIGCLGTSTHGVFVSKERGLSFLSNLGMQGCSCPCRAQMTSFAKQIKGNKEQSLGVLCRSHHPFFSCSRPLSGCRD